ncbi:MAG: hypothetical protein KZQ60_07010 [Candidatus Thiodiazotropha sp. (ex Lucinoma aequizonata)]|nr:hypothetical protein [Candidatus Thiodiazotropha sp. (ex Lucinoma aequizonata)]
MGNERIFHFVSAAKNTVADRHGKRNEGLEMEKEILKKATVFFAAETK